MNSVRTYLLLLIAFAFIQSNFCGRYGGGGRSSSSGRIGSSSSSSRGGYRPSSSSSSTYHFSSSSSGNYRGSSSGGQRGTSSGGHHGVSTRRTSSNQYTTSRTYYSTSRGNSFTTARTYTLGSQRGSTSRGSFTTPRPYTAGGSQRGSTPRGTFTTPRPYTVGGSQRATTPRRSFTTPRTAVRPSTGRNTEWNLPKRVSTQQQSYPQGPPVGGYQGYHGYQGYQGPSKVKIVNKYNYHYPGYHSLPVQSSYAGYYHAPSYYHYSSHDTGSTALGFFLGYGLGRLTTPTYSHHSFYDGYTPRYDHYTVHHYYHNRDTVPQNQEIPAKTIVGCVGDSQTVCPTGTVSLCTNTGALMCVVSAAATVPCSNNQQVSCVKSTIPCLNETAPECKGSDKNYTSVDIPCVSNAKVYGEVKYVDNTIIAEVPPNATVNGTSDGAEAVNGTTTTTPKYSTKYPITTTPVPEATSVASVQKRDTALQDFCVAVVALPAEKKETEGEKVFDDAKDIAMNFIENVWGV